MRHTQPSTWQLRLANASFVLLFLAAVGMLQWLSQQYHLKFDLTQSGRHTLSAASVAVLERLTEPVVVTAFASERGNLRRVISELVSRYQKHKPDIRLEFVDPDTAPEAVRAAGVRYDGEVLIKYAAGKDSLAPTQLNEESFTNALTRLGQRGERWIVYLSGHGERSPDRSANFDLSAWTTQLHQRGFKTRSLSLGEHPQIPDNATVLVIAGPRVQLLPGEVSEIQRYLERGGNLLWLHDPGPLRGLEPLAERLGIEFQPGVIVDPASQTITGNASAIVIARYGGHPVVRNFADVTLFPHAAGIDPPPTGETAARKPSNKDGLSIDWKRSVLLDTSPSSWSETGALDGRVEFNKGKDIRGPLNLGVALTREVDGREQRVAIIGDGDFLSNTFVGNAGNLDFGMSLANWLSQNDAYVSIPVRTAHDPSLALSRTTQIGMAVVFLIALPLGLATSGVVIWLRRRKR